MKYWLFKTEESCFSISDLQKQKRTSWDGVRNFQVRNMIRDEMEIGDKVIFYHSSCAIPAAVGVAKIVKAGYPDHTALDTGAEHPDPRSTKENPIWYMVDIAFVSQFKIPVTLSAMRHLPALKEMKLLEKGSRLSITPLSKKHFDIIVKAGA